MTPLSRERPEGGADQPVHLQAQMLADALHLAVLALGNGDGEPAVVTLHPLDLGLDWAIAHAFDLHTLLELLQRLFLDVAIGPHAVASDPAGGGKLEEARQLAIIGQQQQALGVEIEPADRDQPRQAIGQIIEHRRPSFGIGVGGHQAARLVEHEQPRALARWQRLAVDGDHVIGCDVERR